jgi:hypothetical protein
VFAVSVLVGHHVGVLLKPLGIAGSHVEWADLVDLLVPYAVVGSVLLCLARAGADRRAWAVAVVAALVYEQGHGIHLAANSIGNARGNAQPTHLWDEVVGHYVWYAGTYLLVVALALTLLPRRLSSPWRWPLAVLFGLTVTTNAIEGGTAVFTLLVAAAFSAWGSRHLRASGPVLMAAFGPAAVALIGWGIYWQGFPQFSELGWI